MIKKKPAFWLIAKKELKKKDKKLGKIIDNYPSDFLFSKSNIKRCFSTDWPF